MFPGVDEGLKEFLFQGVPQESCAWVGDTFSLAQNAQELVSVRFGLQDFLVGFTSPQYEASNDPGLLLTYSSAWADDFAPDAFSRLVKFARVEADPSNQYKPDAWKLSEAGQVYQFSQTLGRAVASHSEVLPGCQQYFFWAATPRLEKLYKRTFRYIDRTCLPGGFKPILANTGVLNGYQRT
jgi:hypothetical protein